MASRGKNPQPTTKTFKFPDSATQFVGEQCPKGKFLVCNVCSEWDDEGKKFANVNLRSN